MWRRVIWYMFIFIEEEDVKYVQDLYVRSWKEFHIVRPKCRWEESFKGITGCKDMNSMRHTTDVLQVAEFFWVWRRIFEWAPRPAYRLSASQKKSSSMVSFRQLQCYCL